jgi:hypothetical protein
MRLLCLLPLIAVLTGCPPPQSGACKKYVDCQAAYDAAAQHAPLDTSAYAATGRCWGNETTAAQCTLECGQHNAALAEAAAAGGLSVPACSQ